MPAAMLNLLERQNLFLVALDDQRRWYRYHHLFADVLQAYLTRERPGDVAGLHHRASAWYARTATSRKQCATSLRGHRRRRTAGRAALP